MFTTFKIEAFVSIYVKSYVIQHLEGTLSTGQDHWVNCVGRGVIGLIVMEIGVGDEWGGEKDVDML